MSNKASQGDQPSAVRPIAKAPRTISSGDLFGEDRVIIISHEQQEYRLRITATGKLILTK
jgi:hemin uptake protein HemP